MTDQLTAIFVFLDDVLTAMRGAHRPEDCRRQNSDAEVLTTALAAALFFGGNQERARVCLHANGMVPRMLGKSRFCRRLHALAGVLEAVFLRLGAALKVASPSMRYMVDSFPVALCDNIRISRCKLVQNETFRGKLASKRRFFYGVRVHVVTTEAGLPVEFALLPGSAAERRGLDVLPLQLPAGSELYADFGFYLLLVGRCSARAGRAGPPGLLSSKQLAPTKSGARRLQNADASRHREHLQCDLYSLWPPRPCRLLRRLPDQGCPLPTRLYA